MSNDPTNAPALGIEDAVALHRAGKLAEARTIYEQLLAQKPGDPQVLHLLGLALHQGADHAAARGLIGRAIALRPDAPSYHCNLGIVLASLGEHEQAIGELTEALRLNPNYAQAHLNLGVVFEQTGQIEKAVESYRRAIALRQTFAPAHYNLGNALRRLGRLEESQASYQRAIQLDPNYADAYGGLAATLTELGLAQQAVQCYRRVIDLRPDSAVAHSDLLYAMHYDCEDPAELFAEHLRFAQRHAEPLRRRTAGGGWATDSTAGDGCATGLRLRIGYVSADFREHPVARFQEAVLKHHDRNSFEVHCYSDVRQSDEVTLRIKGWVEDRLRESHGPVARATNCWHETATLSDEQLAKRIAEDQIDILVDLAGHSGGNRLLVFARKPAPVQVTCNGYMSTTGMSAMDYRITDALHDPQDVSDRFHIERLVRLPRCNWCYTPDADSPAVAPPPFMQNGFITFGSLNKLVKVTEKVARLWGDLLARVPGSRLLLSVAGGDRNPSVRSRLDSSGIPASRLMLVDKAPRQEYLRQFAQIDVCLDPFPFNGITTTCDALWMGVPVVSLAGRMHAERAGLSILSAVGLSDLVAQSSEEFLSIASGLARDSGRLSELRRTMRERMSRSPLCDGIGYTRAVEAEYRRMWVGSCESEF